MIAEDFETIRKKYPARLTRGKAIKLYCKENCCAGDVESWKNCQIKSCFLWAFRRGKEEIEEIPTKEKIRSKNDSMHIKNSLNIDLEGTNERG